MLLKKLLFCVFTLIYLIHAPIIAMGSPNNAPQALTELDQKLFNAVSFQNVVDIKSLVAHGANLNAQNPYTGETPLFDALNRDLGIEIIKELITPQNINLGPKGGSTPLHEAAEKNHVDIVRFLIQHGANKNALNRLGESPLHVALKNKYRGKSPLHVALQNDTDINIVKELVTPQNINLISTSSLPETPLTQALKTKRSIDFIKLLINNGADINAVDEFGQVPLHEAITNQADINIIKELISPNNINIRSKTQFTATPLTQAILTNSPLEIIQLLLDAGAKITQYEYKAINNQVLLKTLVTHVSPEDVQHIIPGILALKEKSKELPLALNKNIQDSVRDSLIKDLINEKLDLAHKYKLQAPDEELANLIWTNVRRELSKKKVVQ